MEYLFWILLFFGGTIFAFLQTASPIIVGIIAATVCVTFIGYQATVLAQSFLKVQKEQLATEKERLLLEQQKVDAIMKLDGIEQAEKWKQLEEK